MDTHLLTKAEYHATFLTPCENVTATAKDVLNIWPYVAAVPRNELWGHTIIQDAVERVYRRDARFDHVLVMTTTSNVFLVVVVDLHADSIFGHFLLNLNEEYGLLTPQ